MSLRARTLLNAALVLLIAFFAFARLVPEPVRRVSALLPDQGLRLGLDLRGGIHWVLGVKLERAVAQELEYLRGSLGEQLAEEKVEGVDVSVDAGRLLVRAANPSDLSRAAELVAESDVLREVERGDALVAFGLTEGWEKEVRERAMQQVLEVLRTRIEDPAKGIAESVVTRQGTDRVLVQIPGGDLDREAARSLLEVTGFLEFKIVRDQAPSEELLRAKHPNGLPPGSVIAFERERQTRRPIMAYLVDEQPAITGQYLADARVRFDNRQRPIVSFRWTPEGGDIFGTLTEENKGRLLAIILDAEVKSAPVIKDRISMSGQIEGRFTTQEASDLAIVLRAGSLSVPVVIEEERTVGPALGADSIRRGVLAGLVGSAAIFAFIIVYYRVSGVFASMTLLLNVVMVIGLMSLPEMPGTLTLPGIAGLVLTVGMAVDANVIVFERIREELRAGKVAHAAVDTGFNKAQWTILDANITTLLAALVLYEFGTGPIKGFAVTLSIGLVANVYAAVVLSRLLFDWYLRGDRRLAPLSI